jgi:hypothetical protein
VRPEPKHIEAWARGAAGERRLGVELDRLPTSHIRVLHDRRIPASRANIDHLAVTPSGVFVIDAKSYKGRIERRDTGSRLRARPTLFVNGRDRSKLVVGMANQVAAVRDVLGMEVPVHPVICFVGGEWESFWSKHFMLDGVLVTAWKPLRSRLTEAEPPSDDRIARATEELDRALAPAVH